MNYIETEVPEVIILLPDVFEDERGWLMESYSARTLGEIGIECKFVQINHIASKKRGVLRGIHFQNAPYAQAKLVRCIAGCVMDYAIDLRKNSPTYLQSVSVKLTSENRKQLFIPRGFGHAVVSLTDYSEVEYGVDNPYSKEYDRTIFYKDSRININWPVDDIIVSDKDKNAPLLEESDCNF